MLHDATEVAILEKCKQSTRCHNNKKVSVITKIYLVP